jgi:hypothetical protein
MRTALAALMLMAACGLVQALDTPLQPGARLDLSAQQESLLRDFVAKVNHPPVRDALAMGATLPFKSELHALPMALSVEVPGARTYRFVTGEGGIALVDPGSRRIVQILPLR